MKKEEADFFSNLNPKKTQILFPGDKLPDKVDAVVCMKVADLPTPKEGSIKDKCAYCDAEIWVGRKTLEANVNAPKSCLPCVMLLHNKKLDS
jgi:hypothetical protein